MQVYSKNLKITIGTVHVLAMNKDIYLKYVNNEWSSRTSVIPVTKMRMGASAYRGIEF